MQANSRILDKFSVMYHILGFHLKMFYQTVKVE